MAGAREIGAFEAKTRFSRLLARVEKGERFTITKHGRPVAQILPAEPSATVDVASVISELGALRARTKRGRDSIRDLREAGRRR